MSNTNKIITISSLNEELLSFGIDIEPIKEQAYKIFDDCLFFKQLSSRFKKSNYNYNLFFPTTDDKELNYYFYYNIL